MELEQKKFDWPEMILMTLVVGSADAGEIAGDLSLPIPIIGIVIFGAAKAYSFTAWLGIQFWLIMRGERGLWFAAGSIVDLVAVPFAQTATLLLTLYLANHPKAAELAGAGAAAVVGGVLAARGAGAAAAGTREAGAGAAAAGAETAGAAAGTEVGAAAAGAETTTMAGAAAGAEAGATATSAEAGAAAGKEIPPEALGGEKPPMEKLREELTEKTPQGPSGERKRGEDEEENVELDDDANEVNLKTA